MPSVVLVEVDDIIQIDPEHRLFGGMCAFVTEVRAWGVCANVPMPKGALAGVRLKHGGYQRIGQSYWTFSRAQGEVTE